MDQNTAALVPLLPGCFGWNLARTKCLAGLIIALIKVRTVNFAQLATALPGGALKDSKYKHIQRLFRTFPLDFSTVARFIASQLPEGQYLPTPGSNQLEIRSNPYQYSVLGDPRVIDPVR